MELRAKRPARRRTGSQRFGTERTRALRSHRARRRDGALAFARFLRDVVVIVLVRISRTVAAFTFGQVGDENAEDPHVAPEQLVPDAGDLLTRGLPAFDADHDAVGPVPDQKR